MDRKTASQVLNEILNGWKEITPLQGFSVNGSQSANGYELKLIMPNDKDCLDCVKPIVEKHGSNEAIEGIFNSLLTIKKVTV